MKSASSTSGRSGSGMLGTGFCIGVVASGVVGYIESGESRPPAGACAEGSKHGGTKDGKLGVLGDETGDGTDARAVILYGRPLMASFIA